MAKIGKIEVSSVLNKIMKKCKLVIKILIVIFTFYFTANYIKNSSREAYFYDELAKKYKNNEQKFLLKDLTNFEWDNVKVFILYEEKTYLEFYRYRIKVARITDSQNMLQEKVTGDKNSYIWFSENRSGLSGKYGHPDYSNEKLLNIGDSESIFVKTSYENNGSNYFYYRFNINN